MSTATAQRPKEFRLPDLGEGLTEAEILAWHVRPGDPVSDGQTVVEVETAKASVELPIPFDGTVESLLQPEGATVPVGTPLIRITAPAAAGTTEPEPSSVEGSGDGSTCAVPARRPVLVGYGVAAEAPRRRPRRTPPPAAAPAAPPGASAPDVLAKPPVRKLARQLGVDLAAVRPTGPHGTVTRDDVHAAAAPAPAPEPSPAPAAGDRREPARGVRRATARAMVRSAAVPQATLFRTVDVTATVELVARLRGVPALDGLRVNPLLLTVRALLAAVSRHPDINAAWDEENQEIVHRSAVNLGIAAATPRGLVVPNIKNAGALSLAGLARELGELVSAAREGRTTPEALRGGTLTLTNIGVLGADTGSPLLNPGESAILALGAIRQQPWVHEGRVVPRHVTTLALSFDHRLVDGELGALVLGDTADVLESPHHLIAWA
ncbi:dihydrolipoamide acetyltransferase family protein [Streptomyces sp. YIM 98790]|uniref:dihydrolipoamide acetyltransferase family protein n=1 Tax=Streptomyces sp. YIM 98790 TaxID=2689077 RepID=UPI001408462B|nr:dihydrolipoamide acetyltransferase family protein [Streptomyces sp. YIM 98790]